MLNFILLTLFFTAELALAAPKIQNSDLATPAYLTGAGGTVAQLLNTSNMYNNIDSEVLNTSVARWNAKGSGTVTSVAQTVPAFLSIAGSPITTSGTLAISFSGTALPIANGGTSGTTKAGAFDALSPMTTGGDIIYGGASGTGTRLANGSAGQVLTSGGTTVAPTWATPTTGTVTAVSVVSTNGLAGSSSGGATPALTLSTTITGVLKGNGTAISAASAGTDYQAPISTSAAVTNQFVTGFTSPNTFTRAQPAFTDISGTATVAQTTVTTQALTTCTTARTVDWSTGNSFTLTLTSGNACTLTFSNPTSGQTINLWLTNGAAGGTATVVWPTAKWFPAGAPVMTTGTAALDVCTCTYNGTSYACNCLQNGG